MKENNDEVLLCNRVPKYRSNIKMDSQQIKKSQFTNLVGSVVVWFWQWDEWSFFDEEDFT